MVVQASSSLVGLRRAPAPPGSAAAASWPRYMIPTLPRSPRTSARACRSVHSTLASAAYWLSSLVPTLCHVGWPGGIAPALQEHVAGTVSAMMPAHQCSASGSSCVQQPINTAASQACWHVGRVRILMSECVVLGVHTSAQSKGTSWWAHLRV